MINRFNNFRQREGATRLAGTDIVLSDQLGEPAMISAGGKLFHE